VAVFGKSLVECRFASNVSSEFEAHPSFPDNTCSNLLGAVRRTLIVVMANGLFLKRPFPLRKEDLILISDPTSFSSPPPPRYLGSLTAANSVSFDLIVSCSSC